jgi:flagellum-specific peptidoglycan hydrolase FlgJ
MSRRFIIILQLALISGFYSCSVSKKSVSLSDQGLSTEDYIYLYKDLAVREMKRTGIPASITIAQGMIESDFGRSRLAREANNHFGIKCHSDWTGPTIKHNDDKRNECFRKYSKADQSFRDHSDFLKTESRYSFLFDLNPADYKGWARGLKKAGYATNPDYANMLIRKIEENKLWKLDSGESFAGSPQVKVEAKEKISGQAEDEKPSVNMNVKNAVPSHTQRVMEINRIQYIIVKEGDTKEKLEKEFQLLKWELQKYNDLKSDFELAPGQILFLQPKREKAEPGKESCNTAVGDTMYQISQRYGIKLKSLYEMNRMTEGEEPEVGKKIYLRAMKPVN